MPVTLQLSFPGGRYHATPWGRHVNEGVAEWPPSPWRLLRAMIAVWKRTCPELPENRVREVLEQLVAPPWFYLPRHRVAHTRHYMPWEKKGPLDRVLVFDTFVAVGRNERLLVHWPDATLDVAAVECLRTLAGNLNVLGRAESWVEVELVEETSLGSVPWNCVPDSQPCVPDSQPCVPDSQPCVPDSQPRVPDSQPVAHPLQVFCADPATCFSSEHYPRLDAAKLAKGKIKPSQYLFACSAWHLCLDTETLHEQRWSAVPGSRWVTYSRRADMSQPTGRAADPRRRRLAPAGGLGSFPPVPKFSDLDCSGTTGPAYAGVATQEESEPGAPRPTVARLVLDGPVLPLTVHTMSVAEAVRRAAMGCFRRWCESHPADARPFRREDQPELYASQVLSGKDLRGEWLAVPNHAHYWPTHSELDPRRLAGVTLFARAGFGPAEIAALASLRRLKLQEQSECRIQLIGLGQSSDLQSEWVGPSRYWNSLTPFLGHAKIGTRSQLMYLRQGLRREWRRLVSQQPHLKDVELVEVQELAQEDHIPHGLPGAREYQRSRIKHGGREAYRPATLFRLTFSEPISGPLSLGYGHHFGMGRFVAVPGPEPVGTAGLG